jgi:hypothetical protein
VRGPRDAHPAGAEPQGHVRLQGRRPRVVVLPVDDEHRDPGQPGKLVCPVRRGEQVPAHEHQPVRVVAEHPLAQERHDRPGHACRDGLRLQVFPPEAGHPRGQYGPGRQRCGTGFAGAEDGEHGAQFLRPPPVKRSRTRAHQRKRTDPVTGPPATAPPRHDRPRLDRPRPGEPRPRPARLRPVRPCPGEPRPHPGLPRPGEPRLGQHGLAGDQAAVGVPEQVPGPGGADDLGDVRSEGRGGVTAGIVRSRGLELPAHVDGDHPAPRLGQRTQDREEILLAARVAGDQQRRLPLAHLRGSRGRKSHQRREPAAAGGDRDAPYPVRQLNGGRRAHRARSRRIAAPGSLQPQISATSYDVDAATMHTWLPERGIHIVWTGAG